VRVVVGWIVVKIKKNQNFFPLGGCFFIYIEKGRMRHTEMIVWRSAMDLCTQVYLVTSKFPGIENFGLTSQMRRSAVSVPSNIAEGAGRRTHAEYRYFLYVASGSLSELETQIFISHNVKYLNQGQRDDLIDQINRIRSILHGVIRRLTP